MNERKVLRVGRQVPAIRQIANGGGKNNKAGVRREFGHVHSTIQTICKNRTKIIIGFEQTDRNKAGSKWSMRRCLSGLSNRDMTMLNDGSFLLISRGPR